MGGCSQTTWKPLPLKADLKLYVDAQACGHPAACGLVWLSGFWGSSSACLSLQILTVLGKEPTEFHLRRSGPSASLLRRQLGDSLSMGALLWAPRLPQVCAGPLSPGAQPLLERVSRSLTPWRVAIREETQLHEHACFSIKLPDEASDLSPPLPQLARCTPDPSSLGLTSAHLCTACRGS